MQATVRRQSVDLSAFPDLVVVLLGFRVRRLRGIATLLGIGRGLTQIKQAPPDGLLAAEQFLFGLNHVGLRQYWRDLESLERFTRSKPHADWWRAFSRDSGGAGFWHETYSAKHGIEAIYVDMPEPLGLGRFAPARDPVGPFLSARDRLQANPRPANGLTAPGTFRKLKNHPGRDPIQMLSGTTPHPDSATVPPP